MVNKIAKAWNMYSPHERQNIAVYIAGIMLYKFGLECFNGSITSMASDRFTGNIAAKTGTLTGLNQAMQCVGSIMIAPLIKKFPTRSVLSAAIFVFGLISLILLICDAATGGKLRKFSTNGKPVYGSYDPVALFPTYIVSGIAYGMVELIRRVIPRDIVGGHVGKLKRMDATVHIFYEVAGTIGAFASAIFIKKLGNNYSFMVTPICFAFAGVVWMFIDADFSSAADKANDLADEVGVADEKSKGGYISSVGRGFKSFGYSVYLGSKIIFSSRKFIWLLPGYSIALFTHRYLENNLANLFAKFVLDDSSFQQIIVGGSNFGELLGATTVFFTANLIPTPIPFIRLDALLLLIVWYLPYYYPEKHNSVVAWKMAATFIPISFGWAAGDVSLAAYIQSSLARVESQNKGVSALGAVMAFLYVTYISLYALLSPLIGLYVDKVRLHGDKDVHHAFVNIGGVQFTIVAVIIFASTFIPRGALSFNPKLLENENLEGELESAYPTGEKGKVTDETDSETDEKKKSDSLKEPQPLPNAA